MNLRKHRHRHPALDFLQHRKRVPMQPLSVDALARRQIRSEFAQALAKLAGRAFQIAAPALVEADRDVNQRLQKQPPRPALRGPGFFQHFMAFEEFTLIEEMDSPCQQRVHPLIMPGPLRLGQWIQPRRWNEKAGLRRDALSSQLKRTRGATRRPAMKERTSK